MSKKHPVKSTQSSARTTAPATPRPDARTSPATQASPAAQASDAGHADNAGNGDAGTDEIRARMIAVAAYYLSEQRGFAPGHEVEDWLAAEQQIDSRIESGRGVTGPMQVS